MNPYALIRPAQRRFRTKRMADFARLFRVTPNTRILDVGGTPANWLLCPVRPIVTLLNSEAESFDRSTVPDWMTYELGDGCALPYEDGAFDIVYSNSVIEHVGSWERQRAFAREARRVGRSYYVQTPAKAFPIEPHLLTPGIHWLPRAWQARLLPFTMVGLLQGSDLGWYESVRLLSRREMRSLFPDRPLVTERVAGLPKSYIAMAPP